ncbi:5'-deoxynucleotidase [Sedimentibacter acidaminivorans]|uniref:5'-deoxynucleotidase n=1 Tax=Sedimentibacter acidaminivorans TaxID=913099 RepID=A0ABS4GFB5_9FIRM|nr:5'-deoxynucleotidase [Sedimentibacter acidaminivorans]MBP1926392.1 5'-deoxynucleotidase [Sedimentibacter acidaminivorans]
MKKSNFFAFISRMKYINRWGLMRNTKEENVSEHSLEVAVLAHALAIIQKYRLNKNVNPEKIVLYSIYHDSSEIFTGDLPTPVKYYNSNIKTAYKDVEHSANQRLLNLLPDDFYKEFEPILIPKDEEIEIWKTIKAADKISAYIKCLEEEKSGNKEFIKAKQSILEDINNMNREDVNIFMDEFIEGYNLTLDEM